MFGRRKGKGENDDDDGVCVCETAVEGPACVQGQGTVGSLWREKRKKSPLLLL